CSTNGNPNLRLSQRLKRFQRAASHAQFRKLLAYLNQHQFPLHMSVMFQALVQFFHGEGGRTMVRDLHQPATTLSTRSDRIAQLDRLVALFEDSQSMALLQKEKFWHVIMSDATLDAIAGGTYIRLMFQAPVRELIRHSLGSVVKLKSLRNGHPDHSIDSVS